MKAITKNLLPEEKIRELVKIHFGEDRKVTSVRELTGGFFAAVYLIGVTGGTGSDGAEGRSYPGNAAFDL